MSRPLRDDVASLLRHGTRGAAMLLVLGGALRFADVGQPARLLLAVGVAVLLGLPVAVLVMAGVRFARGGNAPVAAAAAIGLAAVVVTVVVGIRTG